MDQKEFEKRLKAEKEAIQDCNTIAIHDIGYIQSSGYLIACDKRTKIIEFVSENITDLSDLPIGQILGAKLKDFLSREIVHQCNNAMGHSTITTQREYVGRVTYKDLVKDVFAHVSQNRLIVEFQFTDQKKSSNLKMLEEVHQVVSRLNPITNEKELLEQVVFELRAISGYNRVKAYQFLSDGAGEVVAESSGPLMESFLGHRFPSYDIPERARRLYETTPIRIITNVEDEQINLLSNTPNAEPLDLSLALFRGNVPVHNIYLKNMEVQSTLSLPITINGKMWGLFAFHHKTERLLSSDRLAALEMLGSAISLILNSLFSNQRLKIIGECTRVASSFFVPNDNVLGFSSYWEVASHELATLINCDGVGLLSKDQFDSYGLCLSEEVVRKLCSRLGDIIKVEGSEPKPIGIDSIEAKYPDLDCGDIAGVLAIPKPAESFDYLLYFRKDVSKVIRWAGDPRKKMIETAGGYRLNPRASFEEYRATKQKTSETFELADMITAETLPVALSKVMSSIVVYSQNRQRMGLVIRELNHRVRNMLALIGSFITQSKGTSHNIENFVDTLEARISALSETQKLLTKYDWEEVNIDILVKQALKPYSSYIGSRIIMKGDEVSLSPELASLLALVLNELASNASKYGALSDAKGKIELTWNLKQSELHFRWKEKDGPVVEKPESAGFGTTLISEALYYEFNAHCTLDFYPEGVVADFIIPVKNTKPDKGSDGVVFKTKAKHAQPVQLDSFEALVLEDDYIIAKEMKSHLLSLGASHIDTVPSIESAMECLEKKKYDIALLDGNIRGKNSLGVAKILEEKGIPFAFVTGFGSGDTQFNKVTSLGILSKPVSKAGLLTLLKKANLKEVDA